MLSCILISWNGVNYKQMITLRNQCLRFPLGMHITQEDIDYDKNDILIGGFIENVLVACCILKHVDNDTFKLRQMAVSPLLHYKGLGKQILNYAQQISILHQKKKIILEARYSAIPFYKKLGYSTISPMAVIIGIPHLLMEKEIG